MQTIFTRPLPATATRSARIVALTSGGAGRLALPLTQCEDDAGPRARLEDLHRVAAQALATRLNWTGRWVGGTSPGGRGFTFVCLDDRLTPEFTI